LSAEVLDSSYTEVNDSRAVAHVTSPSGKTSDVPVDWTVTRDGDYRATIVPDEAGLYEVKVTATRAASGGGHSGTDGQKEKDLGTAALHVRVSAGDAEYFDAAMRAPLLQRIADETGGRFFTAATASGLPEAVSYTGRGVTVVEERELWDMPALLIVLVGLVSAEWGFRRTRGLA